MLKKARTIVTLLHLKLCINLQEGTYVKFPLERVIKASTLLTLKFLCTYSRISLLSIMYLCFTWLTCHPTNGNLSIPPTSDFFFFFFLLMEKLLIKLQSFFSLICYHCYLSTLWRVTNTFCVSEQTEQVTWKLWMQVNCWNSRRELGLSRL